MTALLLLLVLSIAFANGSNDVSKGVGTLVGSGLATYRRGLAWGTVWTVGGALGAMLASTGLVKTFSTGLLRTSPAEPDRFLLAVSFGVFGWVIFASWMSLPVSTTHAMIGAIVGAALAMDGLAAIQWPLLTMLVVTPLALGPVVAGSLTYVIHAAISRRLSASQYCVCVKGGIDVVRVVHSGGAATSQLSRRFRRGTTR